MSFKDKMDKFLAEKDTVSPFLKLGDGESADIVSLRNLKSQISTDSSGKEYAEMIFDFDVETEDGLRVKVFKTSSSKLVEEMGKLNIDIGSSFTLNKKGEGMQTTYEITNVKNKVSIPTSTPVQTTTPPAPVNPGTAVNAAVASAGISAAPKA